MPKVIGKQASSKPKKPYPDFPLFPHATGRWAKKIRGKLHYFGPWNDPQKAAEKYSREREDLHAGRKPRPTTGELTVRELVNQFLTAKQMLVDSGELTARTHTDYYGTCERVVAAFGRGRVVVDLGADDFECLRASVAKDWGPVALGNEITRVRSVFKYGYDAGLIDAPVRFGPNFKRPSQKTLRHARNEKGPRMFEADELRKVIKAASPTLRAMIYLGINCGFGNADVGTLPQSAIDQAGGWLNYPRPKTGIRRRVPLWPATVKAVKAAIEKRPAPKDEADTGLAFLTKYGQRWYKGTPDNPISKEMSKLLKELGISRPGLNFYALRHTFETIGGESRDQAAVDAIMGHAPHSNDISAVYRERITDERLKAVTDHVHAWLFPPKQKSKASKAK